MKGNLKKKFIEEMKFINDCLTSERVDMYRRTALPPA